MGEFLFTMLYFQIDPYGGYSGYSGYGGGYPGYYGGGFPAYGGYGKLDFKFEPFQSFQLNENINKKLFIS